MLALLLGTILSLTAAASVSLDVYFIDVGKADAILIDYGDWEALLDAGRGFAPQRTELLEVLGTHVADGVIELAILSHSHTDHYVGFEDVFEWYEVEEFWRSVDPVADVEGPLYDDFLLALSAENLIARLVQPGDALQTGSITLSVLGPTNLKAGSPNDNDNSLVLLLSYGTVHFLLPGDIESHGEAGLIATPRPSGRLVLKIAHHGSHTSTSVPFLDWAEPDLAVISTGYATPPALTPLVAEGIPSLMTSESGTIRVSTDGSSFECAPPCGENGTPDDPTPVTGSSPFAGSSPIITEVEMNPAGSDWGTEWIEIHNPTGQPISLAGWTVSTTVGSGGWEALPGVTIAPGGYYRFVYPKQHLENSQGESIQLRNVSSVVVDETPIGLTDTHNDSRTWQRFPDGADPDSLDDWVFATGTPGGEN